MTKPKYDRVSDSALWTKDYRRQFLCIRAALHSLQLQQEERRIKNANSSVLQNMLHDFESVDIAFEALNREETKHRPSEDEDCIPARRKPQRKKTLEEELGLAK